jgi:hypothetical protein
MASGVRGQDWRPWANSVRGLKLLVYAACRYVLSRGASRLKRPSGSRACPCTNLRKETFPPMDHFCCSFFYILLILVCLLAGVGVGDVHRERQRTIGGSTGWDYVFRKYWTSEVCVSWAENHHTYTYTRFTNTFRDTWFLFLPQSPGVLTSGLLRRNPPIFSRGQGVTHCSLPLISFSLSTVSLSYPPFSPLCLDSVDFLGWHRQENTYTSICRKDTSLVSSVPLREKNLIITKLHNPRRIPIRDFVFLFFTFLPGSSVTVYTYVFPQFHCQYRWGKWENLSVLIVMRTE